MVKKRVLISAGHSNTDPGACNGKLTEAKLVVGFRDALYEAICKIQGNFGLFRDGDDGDNLPLTKAISLAKQVNLALEFHFNAGIPAANGVEVLCKKDKKQHAIAIAAIINRTTGIKLRGESGWKLDSSGQHPRLGFCEAGGLIVELGFISNLDDLHKYDANKGRLVAQLASYLVDYMNK